MKLAKSGLFNGDRSLKEIVDEGHIIVDKLINHSLLLENGYGRIEMHGLVRNMVCHILNESHSYTYMVKCNENLRKIPHMREWTVDLEAVSLARNNIKEIPEGTSPNCPRLSTLILSDNSISHIPDESPIDDEFKRRSVCFRDCEELRYLLPRDLRKLSIRGNNQWECLCSALPSNGPSSLKNIEITQCTKLKSLFCLSCSSWTNIQYLESLKLEGLNSLTAICKVDISGLTQILSGMIMFSHLMHFEIMECNKIETLLTPGLVQQLRNLQSINVQRCNSMKEIFAVSNSGDDDSFNIKLPKLTSLILSNLPQLTTVSKGILVCRSENILDIKSCPKLEGHPRISLIVSDNSYSVYGLLLVPVLSGSRKNTVLAYLKIEVLGNSLIYPLFGGEKRTESEKKLDGKYFVMLQRDNDWYWRAFLPKGEDRNHSACNPFGPKGKSITCLKFLKGLVCVAGLELSQDWQMKCMERSQEFWTPVSKFFT
ncbi:Gibberellin receptor GID1C [Spatholobus suberectus]|nr:Gibberellin receptor GID1C [Spatholobus suberectus]